MQKKIAVADFEITKRIFGNFDCHVRRLESAFSVRIMNRTDDTTEGDAIIIDGDESSVARAAEAIRYLKKMAEMGHDLTDQNVDYTIRMVQDGETEQLSALSDECFLVTNRGKPLKAKTVGQKKYIESIQKNTIVICTGPAGTGKTYLAVAMAVKALRAHEVSRIILTRPAVEAGEKLGFLPGDLQSKIDPYLRPLYDSLYEMLGAETVARMMEKMTIEIAPLAYMRGRTLENSFIILDEAQNTTQEQMKMFLTRLGEGSKIVVTGDLTQTDLPYGKKSGLLTVVKILQNIEGIAVHSFTEKDVVRHRLVQKIITAYEKHERENKAVRVKADSGEKRFRSVRKN